VITANGTKTGIMLNTDFELFYNLTLVNIKTIQGDNVDLTSIGGRLFGSDHKIDEL